MKYAKMREEELKNNIAKDFFTDFDCSHILKNIDFAVKQKQEYTLIDQYYLWAEAKAVRTDYRDMLTQLVLTIGKERTFNDYSPPQFLGCFDNTEIVFAPFSEFLEIFYMNDFNWNVAPSNSATREFKLVRQKIESLAQSNIYRFNFDTLEEELRFFIKENFVMGKSETGKIKIDKNNFIIVYNRWLEAVKPTIGILWEEAKEAGILDGDYYLADLISQDNVTLLDNLTVVLKSREYEVNRHTTNLGFINIDRAVFNDGQVAHKQFWSIYERPPREEYWDYIIARRDLLVPQDVRERKGAFYTPKIWVERSQAYMAEFFGENWQDEYYIWDCAAGTGNLLVGLTNKMNIWASTLEQGDVDVMYQRIANGANLLKTHTFKFDLLNDSFSKLPAKLKDIIKNEPQKLIIYINPPYAECGNTAGREQKKEVSSKNKMHKKYTNLLGRASRELFALFLYRIYKEIPGCKICNFAKLKTLTAPNYEKFRNSFQPKLERLFVVPAETFDNVTGHFPIGFHIWDTAKRERFEKITADVFVKNNGYFGKKSFYNFTSNVLKPHDAFASNGKKDIVKEYINDWIVFLNQQYSSQGSSIANLTYNCNDFQHYRRIALWNPDNLQKSISNMSVNEKNITVVCIYYAVRTAIPATWLNDRDQFLYPNNGWESDLVFQNDCLVYTLFHSNNNITAQNGINHWIPFGELDVDAQDKYNSNFMVRFMKGKAFSPMATEVLNAGRELWRYYHKHQGSNPDASFYDIREHFQGRDKTGKMNSKSKDEEYNKLLDELKQQMKTLANKIEHKIYKYGFLKR